MLCNPINRSTPGLPNQCLPKPMSIELVMPSNYLILCHPLLLLPSIFPSIRVFSNESALHIRWLKYWSFSFNVSPGLIFRMDWLDLLAVQGTLNSFLQHHSSKVSILWHSAFFIVQLSHPYMTTGKTIALTRRTLAPTSLLDFGSHQHSLASLACTCMALISVAVVTEHSRLCLPLCIFTWPFYMDTSIRFGLPRWC